MIVKKIGKLILIVILLLAFIYSIYWLWQRQPKPAQIKQETTNQVQTPKPQKAGFVQVPKDSQILSSGKIEISGKVDSEAYIVVVSNSTSAIGRSEKSGEFKIPIELARGLNLLDIQVFNNNLSAIGSEQKTVYVAEGEPLPQNWEVYAGSVKSILDNLITLTTSTGEKSVKKETKTNLILPSPILSKKPAPAPDESIRIGDFAIALGEVKDEILNAQDLEIIRENKPQITRKISIAKILTVAKAGKFSAKDTEANKILDFTLGKNSTVIKNGQSAKDTDIQKDSNAIIVYQDEDDERLADFVYLL
ncbi:hypothetical protein A3D07_02360 [Candidatus Curtissbacteria bacterium RIFCSPHIGHO2_02_FULL_42_15]|uniref:Uncharacterized protein n=1 Tax=Candidatus Curtissbacteria bacterium RIFCSPHIGHO2_02_FULL_42_15 TaxID=1797716 RepID=A0A1F5GIQ3_9BACT|nr:MAG: hypothetical protein A3D07_02360 [Candidatus Curtissbacteria bacterium RIFCSPHIGHO2_02_FULL_42_15]